MHNPFTNQLDYDKKTRCYSLDIDDEQPHFQHLLGRYCIKKILKSFGKEDDAYIGKNPDGTPQWPTGFVGSVTHTKNYVAAVMAKKNDVLSIGIDAELIEHKNVADEITDLILTPEEIINHKEKYTDLLDFPSYTLLLFSAKESIFKCFYPLVQKFFNFTDVIIENINLAQNMFRFRVLTQLNTEILPEFTHIGFIHMTYTHIFTAVVLENQMRSSS